MGHANVLKDFAGCCGGRIARAGTSLGLSLLVLLTGVSPARAQDAAAQAEGTVNVESIAAAASAVVTDTALAQGQTPAPVRTQRRLPPAAYSKTGYIDSAIVGSYARIRFDLGFNNTRADRGEFFYAKCGCYREVGLDPLAPGPAPALDGANPLTTPFIATSVDHRDLWLGAEYRFHERVSALVEGLIRNISPEVNAGSTGFGDLTVGLKAVILEDGVQWATFQLKAFLPTGNPLKGRSTDNTSWEPGLLYLREIDERTTVAGEFRVRFPVGGSSDAGVPELSGGELAGGGFASTVVRYGVGVSYEVNQGAPVVVAPVIELVGWSVLDGYATTTVDGTAATAGAESAEVTIFNVKFGARLSSDRYPGSVYVSYGTALTGASWYDEILRFEYRYSFF